MTDGLKQLIPGITADIYLQNLNGSALSNYLITSTLLASTGLQYEHEHIMHIRIARNDYTSLSNNQTQRKK